MDIEMAMLKIIWMSEVLLSDRARLNLDMCP